MRWTTIVGGLGALLAITASAEAAPRALITNPDWLERPNGETLSQHYPALASALGIHGLATISCSVDKMGRLVDCTAMDDLPKDLGFGAAAIAMSASFRMKPQTLNGEPVDGGSVRIPIRFTLPPEDTGSEPPPPQSPEAMKQAQRLVAAMNVVDGVTGTFRTLAATFEKDRAPEATRKAAAEALLKATEAHKADLRDALARALASVFSEEEMSSLADFATAEGNRLPDDSAMRTVQDQVRRGFWRAMRAPAHESFCAQHPCNVAQDAARIWRPADARDVRIDAPQWTRIPSETLINRTRPLVAGALGLTGVVRMTCRVQKDGALENCEVDEENLPGLGYGAAALSMTSAYRLSPILLESGAAGRKVTVRAGFPPPTLQEPYKAPSGATERTLALARQLSADSDSDAQARRDIELQIVALESRRPKGGDPKIYDDAVSAYRAGALKAATEGLEQNIRAWAATLTEPQLTKLVAFRGSPAGKAVTERRESLEIALQKAGKWVGSSINRDARAMFCKDRVCELPPPAQSTPVSPAPSTRNP